MNAAAGTVNRKTRQIQVCLEGDSTQCTTGTGLDAFALVHNALPELDLADVDCSADFLGRRLRYPFVIEGMTGGAPESLAINTNLACAAEEVGVALGVGSQRAMLEDQTLGEAYRLREYAPTIPLLGNIGASQLLEYDLETVIRMAVEVEVDAIAVHLNAAQEVFQPHGNTSWAGVLDRIREMTRVSPIPIIAKETGCGVAGREAHRLEEAGVGWLDIGGKGGTSWIRAEYCQGARQAEPFLDWGIPTAQSLIECREASTLPIIASGGIRNGVDCAKVLALGASLAGFAYPVLEAATESAARVAERLHRFGSELRYAMFLSGAGFVVDLHRPGTIRSA